MTKNQKTAIKKTTDLIKRFDNEDGSERVLISAELKDNNLKSICMLHNTSLVEAAKMLLTTIVESQLGEIEASSEFKKKRKEIDVLKNEMSEEMRDMAEKVSSDMRAKTLRDGIRELVKDLVIDVM